MTTDSPSTPDSGLTPEAIGAIEAYLKTKIYRWLKIGTAIFGTLNIAVLGTLVVAVVSAMGRMETAVTNRVTADVTPKVEKQVTGAAADGKRRIEAAEEKANQAAANATRQTEQAIAHIGEQEKVAAKQVQDTYAQLLKDSGEVNQHLGTLKADIVRSEKAAADVLASNENLAAALKDPKAPERLNTLTTMLGQAKLAEYLDAVGGLRTALKTEKEERETAVRGVQDSLERERGERNRDIASVQTNLTTETNVRTAAEAREAQWIKTVATHCSEAGHLLKDWVELGMAQHSGDFFGEPNAVKARAIMTESAKTAGQIP